MLTGLIGKEFSSSFALRHAPRRRARQRDPHSRRPYQEFAKIELILSVSIISIVICTIIKWYNMEKLLVADEVWIATALLHRQHPNRDDFTVREIVQQAEAKRLTGGPLRPGVQVFAYLHGVANKAPNPGRDRILVETSKGRRRLFRPGDSYHPRRGGEGDPMCRRNPGAVRRTDSLVSPGVRGRDRSRSPPTRSCPCGASAKRSGQVRQPMPTSTGFERGGNEPSLLGYESFRVPRRG